MQNLTSPRVVKEIMTRHGLNFKKSLGQNFLIDGNIVEKIVEGADINQEDRVLEIGPGIGTLTKGLAARAKKVVAIEIDKKLLPVLEETLGEFSNITIIHGDILKTDIGELVERVFDGHPFKVVANLPYYITTPIVMGFLEEDLAFTTLTVMVQREVAKRMAAKPGDKEYGSLSVAVQYYTNPRIICKVPASVFVPAPKVDSMVIALDRLDSPRAEVEDSLMFFKVVKAAFAKRRKTLLNNLTSGQFDDWSKGEMAKILQLCGVDPIRRGETLSIDEFALIANNLTRKLDKSVIL